MQEQQILDDIDVHHADSFGKISVIEYIPNIDHNIANVDISFGAVSCVIGCNVHSILCHGGQCLTIIKKSLDQVMFYRDVVMG